MNKSELVSLLGSSLSYYADFAKMTRDIAAGVFLSMCFKWHGHTKDPDGWMYKTQDEIYQETGLTRRNQETARKKLKKLGFIEEKKEGVPARLYYRLDIDKITGWRNPPNKKGAIRPTRKAEPAKHSIYTLNTTHSDSDLTVTTVVSPEAHTTNDLKDAFWECMQKHEPGSKPNWGQVQRDCKGMAQDGITVEQVVKTYEAMKRDKFWKTKHLDSSSLRKNIGIHAPKKVAAKQESFDISDPMEVFG